MKRLAGDSKVLNMLRIWVPKSRQNSGSPSNVMMLQISRAGFCASLKNSFKNTDEMLELYI